MDDHHTTDDALIEYALDEADAQTRELAEREIASSNNARRFVERVRAAAAALREQTMHQPPAWLVERVKSRFAKTGTEEHAPDALGDLRRVIARLIFDSRAKASLAGFRASTTAASFQLLYESEAGEVDLRLTPARSAEETLWEIRGQATAADQTTPDRVVLTPADNDADAITAEPDDRGRFRLAAVTGQYELTVRFQTGTLVVPSLHVG